MCSYGALSARIPHCLKKKIAKRSIRILDARCRTAASGLPPSSNHAVAIFSLSSAYLQLIFKHSRNMRSNVTAVGNTHPNGRRALATCFGGDGTVTTAMEMDMMEAILVGLSAILGFVVLGLGVVVLGTPPLTRESLYLWKQQDGLCPVCHQKITRLTGWHSHYLVWRTYGGSDTAVNCVLLHPNCHMQVCIGETNTLFHAQSRSSLPSSEEVYPSCQSSASLGRAPLDPWLPSV